MATSKNELKYDGFVDAVRTDPKSNEQVTLLQGYLGKSSEQGHVRVYFDEELNNFVDVPQADILHSIPNEKSENPLGGSRLWVKKATVVTFGDPSATTRAKSSFLEGDLMSAYGNMGIGAQSFEFGNQTIRNTIACGLQIPNTFLCASKASPCWLTFAQPTCAKTFCQKSCFKTCFQPSCLKTVCQPTCFKTCQQPTCFQHSCFKTCQFICTTPACPVECRLGTITVTVFEPQTPVINPEINPGLAAQQQQMYGGAFDPYQMGGYGY